ncbi:2-acylglycerol O-acyltransferase 2-A [Capsaspora owczarzaki ATCC 30864]|uniref:Acyltransferase n=1 Tax=Capsaspora owczarzaki (strain ATCC 30864) TaxID=595528 RepID=A0A0D2WRX0_CAPO3|nr:2-acylglycerol O-acyltransferase 2-A [Capsaspora owczarzaki ATCC 30864]KJE94068.1 2-acylglycerol O-acyltransferase 2-A [Capsaspora owczarzaki ATCC 30864]|eukprot:XP_004347514.1 2-acylglycerol O-acyltransferase 2-A [Capsaspora owczarzaki ATCC 30864]
MTLLDVLLHPWSLQVAGLVTILGVFKFCESRAAMRGCHRRAMPPMVDKALRVVFFTILVGPFAWFMDTTVLPFPIVIPSCILYLFTYTDLCEQSGGRKPVARKWPVFELLRKYFSVSIVKTADLDPKKQYIFGCHPHGILPFGTMVGMGYQFPGGFADLFPGVDYRVLAATFCFYLPLYRDLLLASGVVDAARYSAHKIMRNGYSITLVPGGATEALYANPDKDVVVLKKRRGFVRLALEHGASLVPVFGFNENNTFKQMASDNKTMHALKKQFQSIFGISLPLITNIIPRRTKVTVVVGRPIEVPKSPEPSDEQVQKYLDLYIEGLKQLYRENKDKYNEPSTKPDLEVL